MDVTDAALIAKIDQLVERKLRSLGVVESDSWLTPSDAAAHARISKAHLLRLVRSGDGPDHVGEGKFMRFKKSSVDRWLASRPTRRSPQNVNSIN